jgi:hypothetical protein
MNTKDIVESCEGIKSIVMECFSRDMEEILKELGINKKPQALFKLTKEIAQETLSALLCECNENLELSKKQSSWFIETNSGENAEYYSNCKWEKSELKCTERMAYGPTPGVNICDTGLIIVNENSVVSLWHKEDDY